MRKALWLRFLAGVAVSCLLLIVAGRGLAFGQGSQSSQESKPAQGQQPPAGQAAQQGQQAGQVPPAYQATAQEAKDFQAVRNELDPEKVVQLVQDYEKKYPNSPYLSSVYLFAANASQQSGKVDRAVDFAEKSLKLKPDNLMSLIMLANMLPQPQGLQNVSDADKDKRLAEAQTDANKALDLIKQLAKQPNQTDEQLQKNKAQLAGGVHASLGLVHLQRALTGLTGPDAAELAKAEEEYKASVAIDNPQPEDFFRLGEVYRNENKTDEAVQAFTKASQLSQGTPLAQMADEQVEKLKQSKSQAQQQPKPQNQ